MPKDGYEGINLKPDTKTRIDELKTEIFGTTNASHDEVVTRLIEEAGYGGEE